MGKKAHGSLGRSWCILLGVPSRNCRAFFGFLPLGLLLLKQVLLLVLSPCTRLSPSNPTCNTQMMLSRWPQTSGLQNRAKDFLPRSLPRDGCSWERQRSASLVLRFLSTPFLTPVDPSAIAFAKAFLKQLSAPGVGQGHGTSLGP